MTLEQIKKIVIDLDIDNIAKAINDELAKKTDPQDILKALTQGMDEVGRLYEKKEYYLTELVLAGETMKEAFAILKPLLAKSGKSKGTVVAATVKGDNHDIGKNILVSLLMSAGYTIVDLGMDVPETKIVEAVKNSKDKLVVVALSSLLTMTVEEISVADKALKAANLRNKVKIIVGGAPLNMELAKKLGADDYADDAVDGVRHIAKLLGAVK